MKYLFLLIVFVFMSALSMNAQTYYGCVSDDTGLIYPNEAYGTTYEPTDAQSPGVGNYCKPKYLGTCRIRSKSKCRGCGNEINGWYYQPGYEYSFVACPIDDYLPNILLVVSGAGFLFIRRKAGQLRL